MPDYRITLTQNMRADERPSALQVKYTYNNGQQNIWPAELLVPSESAVAFISCPANLLNQSNVRTRTLIGHYTTQPITVDYGISSVQPLQPLVSGANVQSEAATLAAGSNYSINFAMNQQTVETLSQNDFVLFGFKAVKSISKGAPVVWFSTSTYGTSTDLEWSVQFQAYTTAQAIVPGGKITAKNPYNIDLGQSLLIDTPQGTGIVNTDIGVPGAISIVNQTETGMTCGISQFQPNSTTASPMCAFPLFGNMTDVIVPIEKVLIMFAAGPFNTGTVIELSSSQGVLVDLTSENQVDGISFDINKGWSTGGQSNCSLVPSNSNLVDIMVQKSKSLSQSVLGRTAPRAYAAETVEV